MHTTAQGGVGMEGPVAEKEQYGVERRGLRARGWQQPGGLLGVDHPEWSGRRGGFYPKMPPKMEAMTMPRTTQQMMIMIFFRRALLWYLTAFLVSDTALST